MKLLMIYADSFGYTPTMKTLEEAPEVTDGRVFEKALVGFIQIEAEDQDDAGYIETKLVKNLKWAARKNETELVILHSFAHLSESKAEADFTRQLFDSAEQRLIQAGYRTAQTPFGYFHDLKLSAPGFPLARLFKDIRPR
ncbi:MAG: hypothetical protein GF404_11580 [candidate division Zixibacteria bacterium]|jgi:hypothetical protein|nr:hypothetical protein [candidate division Zixibacteria bacterium]